MKNVLKIFLIVFTFFSVTKTNAQIPDRAENISPLLIGETLPKATLQNAEGQNIELSEVMKKKPTVLVFYRGGWCPYCNLQLSGLAKIEKDILKLGYQIVAISPDDYLNLKDTEEKESLNYTLLSDKDGKFISNIGIAFQTPSTVKGYISKKGNKGKTSDVIPVPTVMVVNTAGEIQFEYINPNYKSRLSSEMLLAVLKTIN